MVITPSERDLILFSLTQPLPTGEVHCETKGLVTDESHRE